MTGVVTEQTFVDARGSSLAFATHRAPNHRGSCLSLHGGGPSSKETTDYLVPTFARAGYSWASLDFSGQGRSSGPLAESSLERRLGEAVDLCTHLDMAPLVLIGTSMGGSIATKLTEVLPVDRLILFCPAAYSVAAWGLRFGHGFTQEIRRPNSFLDTDAAEVCGRFRGRVLLVFGDQDEVIPPAVQTLYKTAFHRAESVTFVEIPGCPHPIHRWLEYRHQEKQRLLTRVGDFLATPSQPQA